MEPSTRKFFETLLATPGVSGYEQKVQDVVRTYAADFTDSITTDLHGNVILCKNPDAEVRVMLAGHCDQIGLLVSQVDETGVSIYANGRRLGSPAADRSASGRVDRDWPS